MKNSLLVTALLGFSTLLFSTYSYSQVIQKADERSAYIIVKEAIEYWRDNSSYIEASMTVHRADWKRTMAFKCWTRGTDDSLVRFTAPAKDAGSASLTTAADMWSFSPKISKVIKIPASMRSQSWMGSDFSYQDLARADELIDYYQHKLLQVKKEGEFKVYVIESVPDEDAPVVWGKEILKIREDHIMLEQTFYDQDMIPIKKLVGSKIEMMGGKLYTKVIRMQKASKPEEWTEIIHEKVNFGAELPNSVFTLSNLRNPREKSL